MNELISNIESYLSFMDVKNYASNTIKTYEINLRYFYSYCSQFQIDYINIKGSDMIKYVQQMSKYKGSTINLRLSSLRGFYDYLIDMDIVSLNPVRQSLYIRHSRKKPKPLLASQEKAFLEFISKKDEHIKLAFILLLETGLRLSELKKIKESNFIKINNKYYLQVFDSKNHTNRKIPLSSEIYNLVLDYAQRNIFSGTIFNLSNRAYQYHCDIFAKQYQLKFSVHSLRHTYATKLSQKGTPLQIIQVLLGHKNIMTTMYYIDVTDIDILNL